SSPAARSFTGGPCGEHGAASSSSATRPIGAMAARLGVTIEVTAGHSPTTRCVVPRLPSDTLRVGVGDTVEFVAHDQPTLAKQDAAIVEVSSRSGPTSPGPLATRHVVVTVTALAPGTVTLDYIDCSGTGC